MTCRCDTLLVWVCDGAATAEKYPLIPPLGIYPREMKTGPYEDAYKNEPTSTAQQPNQWGRPAGPQLIDG